MRKQKLANNITVDPRVRFGKPVIENTRVPIDLIVGKIAAGMTLEQVMKEYKLNRKQVLAALRYAASLVAQEKIAFA